MKHETCEHQVDGAQNIARMCFVCGEENNMGLHAQFLELDDGRLVGEFTALDQHQSYPDRTHGGVISAILDETIGRALQVAHPEIFGVTLELHVKFRKPVPLNVPLKVIAEITKDTHRAFEGEGKLLLEDGSVAAEATARYLRLPVDHISEGGLTEENWRVDTRDLPKSVEV
jgi:acyl-coenzyme A thioesterase PaaI-like protein